MKAASSLESILSITINPTDEQEGELLAATAPARVLHGWIVERKKYICTQYPIAARNITLHISPVTLKMCTRTIFQLALPLDLLQGKESKDKTESVCPGL